MLNLKGTLQKSRQLQSIYYKFGSSSNSLQSMKDPSFIDYDEAQFSKEQNEYILKIQNMKYTELLGELKKYSSKPENRQRKSILKHIVSCLPQQNGVQSISNNEQKFNLQQDKVNSEDFDIEQQQQSEPQKLSINNVSEDYKEFIESEYLQDYNTILFANEQQIKQNKIFFLENCSKKQIMHDISNYQSYEIRKEINLFSMRSEYMNELNKSFSKKITNISDQNQLKQSFCDLVMVENEYLQTFRDYQRKLMKELQNNKLVNTTIFQLTSQLADSIQFWNYASFIRFSLQSSLMQFWKSLTLLSEFYDANDIELLLRAIMLMKKNSKIQHPEENEFFEQLSGIVLESLEEDKSAIPLQTIANILSYFNSIDNYNPQNFQFTEQTLQNLKQIGGIYVSIFSHSYIEDNTSPIRGGGDEHIPNMPDQIIRYIDALNYVDVIPQVVINEIFDQLVKSGFKHYEKQQIIKVLSQCMMQNIVINEELAKELRDSKKIIMDLSIRDIYIIIHTFQAANLDIGSIYNNLYFATGIRIDNLQPPIDFKTLMMVAKIHHYILTVKLHDHRRVYLDKRSMQVLNLIENSLNDTMISQNINDIIYIVSLYLPFLNVPDFLVKEILKHRFEIKIDTESRNIYSSFVQKLLDKLKNQYTIVGFLSSPEVEINNKLTKEMKQLMQYLVLKFRESRYLSYFLQTIHIGAHESSLFSRIFTKVDERRHIVESSSKQILKQLKKQDQSLGYSNLILFTKFLYQNRDDLNKRNKQNLGEILTNSLIVNIEKNKKKQFNTNMQWIYHLLKILGSNTSPVAETGLFSQKGEKENNKKQDGQLFLDSLQKVTAQKKLKKYVEKELAEYLSKTYKICQSQIQYDESIVQRFNANAFSKSFENAQYLLPLISELKIQLTQEQKEQIFGIVKRTVKMWEGNVLVENLEIIHDLSQGICFEVFEVLAENLFTCFYFDIEKQFVKVNSEILDKDVCARILRIYSKQYKNYLDQGKSVKNGEQIKLTGLPILMNESFDLLTLSEMIILIKLVGNNIKYYPQQFIDKFCQKDFQIHDNKWEENLGLLNSLPEFLNNDGLKQQVMEILDKSLKEDFLLEKFQNFEQNHRLICNIIDSLTQQQLYSEHIIRNIVNLSENSQENFGKILPMVRNYIAILGGQNNSEGYQKLVEKVFNAKEEDDMSVNIPDFLQIQNKSYQDRLKEVVALLANSLGQGKEIPYQIQYKIKQFIDSPFFHYFQKKISLGDSQSGQIQKISYFDSFAISGNSYDPNFKIMVQSFEPQMPTLTMGKSDDKTSENLQKQQEQQQQQQEVQYEHFQRIFHDITQIGYRYKNSKRSQVGGVYLLYKYFVYLECTENSMNYLLHASRQNSLQNNRDEEDDFDEDYEQEVIQEDKIDIDYEQQAFLTVFEEFSAAQLKMYNEIKMKEDYSDFLIDITLGLQEQHCFYKTQVPCEITNIMLDIMIPEKKIGFIYMDKDQYNKNVETGENQPNSFSLLKKHVLEKFGGWDITLIQYEQFAKQHPSRDGKIKFINEIFDRAAKRQPQQMEIEKEFDIAL